MRSQLYNITLATNSLYSHEIIEEKGWTTAGPIGQLGTVFEREWHFDFSYFQGKHFPMYNHSASSFKAMPKGMGLLEQLGDLLASNNSIQSLRLVVCFSVHAGRATPYYTKDCGEHMKALWEGISKNNGSLHELNIKVCLLFIFRNLRSI